MGEQFRSDQDVEFARNLAEMFRAQLLDFDRAPRLDSIAESGAADLLASLVLQVSRYSGKPPSFLLEDVRHFLENEIVHVRRLFADGCERILVLKHAGNGFGLDVVVDIFNPRARRTLTALSQREPNRGDEEAPAASPPLAPPLTREWIDSVMRGPAPVRLASKREGWVNFLTLFGDALRMVANAAGSSSRANVYIADCNLKGWTLESWPQFNYSPTRFGNRVTGPVHDTLPTSGNYMFQGLKGTLVRQDSTPHYLGPSRNRTLVKL